MLRVHNSLTSFCKDSTRLASFQVNSTRELKSMQLQVVNTAKRIVEFFFMCNHY